MTESHYFSSLTSELARRAARAALSQLGIRSEALRRFLRTRLEQPAGEPGSFIAEPVFEAMFGWKTADRTMRDLAGPFLHPDLVGAMDAPGEDLAEYRFGADWHPYAHQVEAWRVLGDAVPKSAIVTSGTGSGKTECFLVPILNDLLRERDRSGRLVGVRALFLYPLNALINSQRDRLKAWTRGFRGDLRFCLYNGETPETGRSLPQAVNPEEVMSRELLRREPPPILVTNATMLEYMLVRSRDAPILQASQGVLRWIVLDEVHTYIGSQAAELALLLRRVALAFGVKVSDVRYVATSATVGGGDGSGPGELRQFLADVVGVGLDRVHVIEGSRSIPPLPRELGEANRPLAPLEELARGTAEERFAALASSPQVRQLRERLGRTPMRVGQIASLLKEPPGSARRATYDSSAALALLDFCATATLAGTSFLPLRGHIFHRTQPGIWACCNPNCTGRRDGLEDPAWPFGAVYLERREQCSCGAPAFEMLLCSECGTEYLTCEEAVTPQGRVLRQSSPDTDYDEFQEEFEALEPAEGDEAPPQVALDNALPRMATAARAPGAIATRISKASGAIVDTANDAVVVGLLAPEPDNKFTCWCCSRHEGWRREVFRPARLGAPFLLGVAIPTLLEHTPKGAGELGEGPSEGRRLLTFSDSRQGTARFAVKAQLDAERNHVRSVVYHLLASRRQPSASTEEIETLERTVQGLEQAARGNPVLRPVLEGQRRALAQARVEHPGRISWRNAAESLPNDKAIRDWMPDHWRQLAFGSIRSDDVARFCLYREFLRRPTRLNSLETLGLVALSYPRLTAVPDTAVPVAWARRGQSGDRWRDFLKVCVDFFVRAYTAVDVPDHYIRWLGLPVRKKFLIGPDAPEHTRWQVVWPLGRGTGRPPRLVRLLSVVLKLDLADPDAQAVIEECLRAAWVQIQPLLRHYPDGYLLSLEEQGELVEVREAWLCPVTKRLIDTTVGGVTPYLPANLEPSLTQCVRVTMPVVPHPYWRLPTGQALSVAEALAWLETDATVGAAREAGVWPEFSDRIAAFAPYFRVAEHSAQQGGDVLRRYEASFKRGRLNILSCSTTMEMGVDIGGLSAVAMNNAPPSPANFLQRAGRAGRRGEPTAASLTLCKSTPHGEAVFRNPLWPFATSLHVPRVSLQSERIVQRHVNAVALARFLQLRSGPTPQHRLQVGWFFERDNPDVDSPAEAMREWCESPTRLAGDSILAAIATLVRRTVYDGIEPERLLSESARQIERLAERWTSEVRALEDERQQFGPIAPGGPRPPALAAIERQLGRMRGEYLLSELTAKNFLPGYGFPTGVVPFISTTSEELRQQAAESQNTALRFGREDSSAVRRGYPTRELSVAIREYAPGADVILDGRVYRSDGVTLNWHIPPGNNEVPELQAFRHAWRCRSCGLTGTHPRRVQHCLACGSDKVDQHEYLQPSGFAVDIRYEPHNDISRPTYIPVKEPWVTAAGAEWLSLPRPEVGRYRYSPTGHIYQRSYGLYGFGFALCLRCGRAASEEGSPPVHLPFPLQNHSRLRGGRDAEGTARCSGNDDTWAIKRHLQFGTESQSDVFELQLHHPVSGMVVTDQATAYSIGVALRHALTERLGVEEGEVGVAARLARTATGGETWSIILYDMAVGGAGYVATAAQALPSLLLAAREVLECPRDCDDACHACLLSFDTQYQIEHLKRRQALAFLTPALLDSLALPSNLKAFGADTVLEYDLLGSALRRELQRPEMRELRLHLGGDAAAWDFLEWPVKNLLLRLSTEGVRVTLHVEQLTLDGLDAALRNTLASLVEISAIDLVAGEHCPPIADGLFVLAEIGGEGRSTRWAVPSRECCAPGMSWGNHGGEVPCVRSSVLPGLLALGARPIDKGAVRRSHAGTLYEIRIGPEADGAIGDFGQRFWGKVLKDAPSLRRQMEKGGELKGIRYSDRYLRAPLAIRLLQSALAGLRDVGGVLSENLAVEVRTAELGRGHLGSPWKLSHDWAREADREAVLSRLLNALPGKQTVSVRNKAQLPHARELTLTWTDGKQFTLRLDEGLGYWRSVIDPRFDFDRPAVDQAAVLGSVKTEVRARSPLHPTYVYVCTAVG
jgi:ATP-dependent helicase YprA (DUF1998 family)